ncbi:MAG: divalent-cation tolerance protein CutA [Gemmatimonadales bacterium]
MNKPNSVSHLVVFTTAASVADARSMVRRLVTDRLVACGTILEGAQSIYRWQGGIEETPEVMVVLKTTRERWDALRTTVREIHPYEIPELLALPVSAGHPEYLDWVQESTRTSGTSS